VLELALAAQLLLQLASSLVKLLEQLFFYLSI
jgi:hypothetical protein